MPQKQKGLTLDEIWDLEAHHSATLGRPSGAKVVEVETNTLKKAKITKNVQTSKAGKQLMTVNYSGKSFTVVKNKDGIFKATEKGNTLLKSSIAATIKRIKDLKKRESAHAPSQKAAG